MKEAFENIIKKLEERKKLHSDLSKSDSITEEEKIIQSRFCGCFCRAIQIVKEVAEEYGNSKQVNVHDINVGENDGWIPCSERLPEEEYDTVLAVTERNHYCVAVYTTEHGFRTMDIDCEGDFVAWQPLPEPYKEETK